MTVGNDIPGVTVHTQPRLQVWTLEEVRRRLGIGSGTIARLIDPVVLVALTTATTVSYSTVTDLTAVLLTPLDAPAATQDWYLSSRVAGSQVVISHGSNIDNRTYQCVMIG